MQSGDRPSVAFRTMPASDLPAALAIETASYPADEAATAALRTTQTIFFKKKRNAGAR